ncbi:MAG: flavin reductase family protein [Pseudomonadota bacterium]
MDQKAFRNALGAFPTGVTIVTVDAPDGPLGFTANSFASVSLDPPLVLWSPAVASPRFEAFVSAEKFVIHILSESQEALALSFAESANAGFAGRDWAGGDCGPEFPDTAAKLRCQREVVHPGGDHNIIVGRVLSFEHDAAHPPLVFHRGAFPRLS